MKQNLQRVFSLLLALILCLSIAPVSALAEMLPAEPPAGEKQIELPTASVTTTPEASEPLESDESASPAPTQPASSTSPAEITSVEPELVKVVSEPLVKVVYHYYDAETKNAAEFSDYAIASSHAFYAIAMANGETISIAANKHPDKIQVSTDSLRFRVLRDNSEDITVLAAYDPATGRVYLPSAYMGHRITVEWYCPVSEVAELPVQIAISTYRNGVFTDTSEAVALASDTNMISIPLERMTCVTVSQNGIELDASMISGANGVLHIATPAVGGDLSVQAYALSRATRATGEPVSHTRSEDQIYYGYYTSYYTAQGNTAFCVDPNVKGLNSGTYSINRYLQRGRDDLLIKCAYYLFGGPGYNSVKNALFSEPNTMEAYGLCHAAASYAYLNNNEAFEGLSSSVRTHLKRVVDAIAVQPMPPDGFEVFIYNEGSSASQPMMGWEYTPTGSLEIIKVSGNTEFTSGNNSYSLADAVFGVYGGGSKLGTITTDANGRGRLDGIEVGLSNMYIVEETPPKGYIANPSPIPFTIVSNQTTTQTITNKPQNDPIGILLQKRDKDTASSAPQGNAGLADAEFTVKYYKGHYANASQLAGVAPTRTWVLKTDSDGTAFLNAAYLVSGNAFYYSGDNDPTFPLGTVTIQETKAPPGYQLNNELFIRHITANGRVEDVNTYNYPIVDDPVSRGGISIEKWDAELNRRAEPQGDATLAGSVIDIYNRSSKNVFVGGRSVAPGAVVHTLTTDASGVATSASDLLPFGDYEAVERTAPSGYLNTGVLRQSFTISQHGVIVNLKSAATVIKNNVIRGGVEVEKWDTDLNRRAAPQGDATLEGAVFEVYNRGQRSVLVNGVEYAPGKVVLTLTTDANGWAGTVNNALPYSTYEIVEKTSPAGYLNTGILRQTFTIRSDGVVVSLKSSNQVIKNDIIRGGLLIEKWDHETGKHKAQGGATFGGAVFEIVNRSKDSVMVQDKLYDVGEVVFTLTTDETGTYTTASTLLPYGTYECREISPPEGYLATGVLARMFVIREHGKIVEMNKADTAIRNNPIRGDLRGVKISDGDHIRMAGIPFRITSLTTGEAHIIVTDKNGEINTSSAWNPHSQDTNRGESDRDGIWFGEIETLNDDLGALLYDNYLIEELPCEANKDKELLKFRMSVYRHMTVVNLGTMTNDYIPVPEISTTAIDGETTMNSAYASETSTIVDTVYYGGLKAGQEYTLKGILMDKESGQPLLVSGKEITSEAAFKATGASGSATMKFIFDSRSLAGKSVVVFETLFMGDTELASHAEIASLEQTISYADPKLRTNAAGPDGKKEIDVRSKASIVDTVAYDGLIAGETYTVHGILMDKSTGKPLLSGGEEITASTTFKAQVPTGTVKVTFNFSSVDMAGKTVVVFETLSYKEREIAVHANIDDEAQTCTFPQLSIGTSAAGSDGAKVIPLMERAVIIDTVSYSGLTKGETYILQGILMDKESGEPLMVDGREITASKRFTAAAESGKEDVRFVFNSASLKGKSVVVFETLTYKGEDLAIHADLESEAQTVTFAAPAIGTSAAGSDGSKVIPLMERAVIIDTVSYSGLMAGESYVLEGVLMDKATGEPLMVDGREVTAVTKFQATSASGTAKVVFTLNSVGLAGKKVVVFETLMYSGVETAVHADITDQNQTVSFAAPSITTSAAGSDGAKVIPLAEKATIVDTVSYSGLTPGETYELSGILMDKETGKPILLRDKEITAKAEFRAETQSGTTEVVFTFDSVTLSGRTAVVFETLRYKGNKLAVHEDINSEAQTVTFAVPKISTSASAKSGGKTIPLAEKAVVVDTVAYEGLTPGTTYVLKGCLMDKETGKPLLVNDKEVASEVSFVPANPSGSVDVIFTFDSTALAGKTLVVFETLLSGDKEIAAHADINDNVQTVTVSKTPGGGAQTGRDGLPTWLLVLGILSAAGAVIFMRYLWAYKRIRKDK